MKIRTKFVPFLVLCCSAALLAAATRGDVKKGKELYAAKCANCHGDKGEGKPAIEKMFKIKLKPLASKEVQSKTDEALAKNITAGSGKMIAVKMSTAEASDIVAYLRTLAQPVK
jgi:mono/diheme cytochrome c family protein